MFHSNQGLCSHLAKEYNGKEQKLKYGAGEDNYNQILKGLVNHSREFRDVIVK